MLDKLMLTFWKYRLGVWLVRRVYATDRTTHDYATRQISRLKKNILDISPRQKRGRNSSSPRPVPAYGKVLRSFSVAVPKILFDDVRPEDA